MLRFACPPNWDSAITPAEVVSGLPTGLGQALVGVDESQIGKPLLMYRAKSYVSSTFTRLVLNFQDPLEARCSVN